MTPCSKHIFGINCFLLKRNSMKFGGFHILKTTQDFCSCPYGKTPPKPFLLLVNNLSSLSQLIQTSFGFYFNYFISQIFSDFHFEPEPFTKQVPNSICIWTSNQLYWLVLGTLNLEPSWSTHPLFKFFKLHSLQVWTRFAKFGEIHIYTSPKIPPKIR